MDKTDLLKKMAETSQKLNTDAEGLLAQPEGLIGGDQLGNVNNILQNVNGILDKFVYLKDHKLFGGGKQEQGRTVEGEFIVEAGTGKQQAVEFVGGQQQPLLNQQQQQPSPASALGRPIEQVAKETATHGQQMDTAKLEEELRGSFKNADEVIKLLDAFFENSPENAKATTIINMFQVFTAQFGDMKIGELKNNYLNFKHLLRAQFAKVFEGVEQSVEHQPVSRKADSDSREKKKRKK